MNIVGVVMVCGFLNVSGGYPTCSQLSHCDIVFVHVVFFAAAEFLQKYTTLYGQRVEALALAVNAVIRKLSEGCVCIETVVWPTIHHEKKEIKTVRPFPTSEVGVVASLFYGTSSIPTWTSI